MLWCSAYIDTSLASSGHSALAATGQHRELANDSGLSANFGGSLVEIDFPLADIHAVR
jgi:hypothetical protein